MDADAAIVAIRSVLDMWDEWTDPEWFVDTIRAIVTSVSKAGE